MIATLAALVLVLVIVPATAAAAFGVGYRSALRPRRAGERPRPGGGESVRFDVGCARATSEWHVEMERVGRRLYDARVAAVVFVHGTFTGTDPLSAYGVVERALPGVGRDVARALRKRTRTYVDRLLGDRGNFGPTYARLFESAIRQPIPCTPFVWSSENHHVGRLDGALGLVRVLAAHALIAEPSRDGAPPRILVYGHSHAGQVFAIVSQLLARSIATEAIVDVARARGLDIGSLDVDLEALARVDVDFVTFGAPSRYAWAKHEHVRVLHVTSAGDWIQRLGQERSDFPAFGTEDRRINASLHRSGWLAATSIEPGERIVVEYGTSTLFHHACYTRLDNMLFHARLVTDHLYPEPAQLATSRGGQLARVRTRTLASLLSWRPASGTERGANASRSSSNDTSMPSPPAS